MKLSIRPSDESAGWLTESAKFVICTHSLRAAGGALRFDHQKAAADRIAARRSDERAWARAGAPACEAEASLPDTESSRSSSSATLISATWCARRSPSLRRQREMIFSKSAGRFGASSESG